MTKKPEIPKPKAIIFDWDNTLVDSWVVIQDALNATFADFDMKPWSLEETRANVGVSLREGFPVLFGDAWEAAAKVFYGHIEAIHLERLTPMPGAAETLAGLSEMGFYLAVVSNKTGYLLRREAGHLGWDVYFQRLVGAQDAARDKPATAPMEMALKGTQTALNEADVWYVGDAPIDVECAKNAGCRPILVGAAAQEAVLGVDSLPALHNLAQKL